MKSQEAVPGRPGRGMLVLALLVAACTADSEPEPRRSARGTAGGAVGATIDSSAPVVPDTTRNGPTEGSADSAWTAGVVRIERSAQAPALLSDIRIAAHEGFDRIVLDFGADELPGYRIEYIDRPVRACGSGEVVELPGDAWLSIDLSPANAHDEEGRATVTNRDRQVGLPVILRVRSTCDFEAVVTWVAGVRAPNPFRVLELEEPSRIVVDVRH